MRKLGAIPVVRRMDAEGKIDYEAFFASCVETLAAGESIVIFPEGTYYRRRMGIGHVGLIRMVQSRSTVPFIPVGINYMAKSARTLVEINFGRAVYKGSLNRIEPFLDQMMKEIARLSGF